MDISIIVPVYNAEKYLKRCINSIVNQSFCDFELILINDGSTDKSGRICDEYAQIDKRIKVVHKKNEGVSLTRNLGINIANGEYITFIDSDDWIEQDFFKKAIEYIKKNDVSILITSFVFEYNKKVFNVFCGKKDEIILNDEIKKEFFKQNKFTWTVYDKFFKKEIIKKCKFDSRFKIGEDMLFCWQILKNEKKIGYLPLYKYHYDISASKTMSSDFSLKWFDGIKVKKMIYNDVKYVSRELELLARIVCIVELVVLSKKAMTSNVSNTERLIKLLQYYIRKNIYIVCLYPRSNIMTFRQRLGMLYFFLPYKCCNLVRNILKRFF
jgi:glycosyltransferase involved in cell wall biosynthesis